MMAGQTINDRLLAARHSIAGQGLAKSVCKATTEEMIAPKKKHLDYLVHCTNEPNVSIPQLANLLVERTQQGNWIVVYKSLITCHHLLAYGNERFTQYLASSNATFQLSNFLDKSGVQGSAAGARIGYDMSPFIRRYARYLNEKALSYRTVAFDFCKVKRGKEEGSLRMMSADALLKTLPALQAQLDALLEFEPSANELTNGVINMCFMLLFRDLIRLFACYNDGIINLLEKYFDMNKKNCRDALDLYKKFLIRMDRVGEFLKVAENVGIDKGDIPDLTRAPSSLLDALEGHLATLEGKKSQANTPTQHSAQKNVASSLGALSSTSTAFGDASERANNGSLYIDDSLKQQVLAEEEQAINQYKNKVQSPTNSAVNNPFLSSNNTHNNQSSNIVDLFGSAPEPMNNGGPKASDDLLSLGNPFADAFNAPATSPAPLWPATNMPTTNGNGLQMHQTNAFVSDASFNNVFNADHNTAANPFMGMGNPTNMAGAGASPARPPPPKSAFDELEDVMRMSLGGSPAKKSQPLNQYDSPSKQGMGQQPQQAAGKVLTGDLDSSLASLANNLSINKAATAHQPIQWNSPKAGAKGTNNWSPQPMQATTGANYRPMGAGLPLPALPHTLPQKMPHSPVYPPMPHTPIYPQLPHGYHPPHFVMQQGPGITMAGVPPSRPPPPTNQFS